MDNIGREGRNTGSISLSRQKGVGPTIQADEGLRYEQEERHRILTDAGKQ